MQGDVCKVYCGCVCGVHQGAFAPWWSAFSVSPSANCNTPDVGTKSEFALAVPFDV